MKNYISMFIMIIVGFVLQTTVFRELQIASVSPNILVILTVISGTMYGQYNGLFAGTICGLLVDLLYSSVIGVNIFIYAVVGFIAGMTNKVYIEDDFIFPMITIAVGDLIYGVLFYALKFLLRGRLDFLDYIINTILPEAIYTIIVGIFVFKFAHWLDEKLNPPTEVRLGVESKFSDD